MILNNRTGRVFQAISRIVEARPMLASDATVNASKITFRSTGSTITAIASDYAGAAGANPTITVFDELWGYTSERSHRLWDEMVPPPTRKIACRLTVTYAASRAKARCSKGCTSAASRASRSSPISTRSRYADVLDAPAHRAWQTEEWREQMREQLRPNAYLRLIENRWVTSDSTFVDMAWWDACVDPGCNAVAVRYALSVWCGVDASVKRDSTAIVACAYDRCSKKVRLIWHRIFQPIAADPLDFEATIEKTLLDLRAALPAEGSALRPVSNGGGSQRLLKAGVPMVEFPQSVPNLTEASHQSLRADQGATI